MPADPATHPSAETLRALGLGKLDGAEAEAVLSHLGSCPDCCRKAATSPGDTFTDRLRDAHTRSEAPARAPSGGTEAQAPASGPKAPWSPQEFPTPFGRYRVLKLLGKGGMGAVYLAYDTQLDRHVALKVPHFEEAEGPQVLERFYREAKAAATVQHPNICPLYDVGEIDGTPYLTMAYVEGKPLEELAGTKPLTPKQAAFLVRKLALALAEAHKRGVIHRDLKPSNVMIDKRGEAMIMDFGLARRTRAADPRLTQQGAFLGTPAYAPPEQISGEPDSTGPACDVYSLGVILYELLAGRLPFTGDVLLMLSRVLLEEPPPPSQFRPDLPPALEAVCLKAMAKKVEDRYASMAELAAALAAALRAKPPAPAPKAAPAAEATTEAEGIRVSQLGGLRSVANLHAQLPARKAGADRPRRPRLKRPSRGRVPAWAWLVGAAVGVVLLVGLGAVLVFKLRTKDGTLVVEVNEPGAEVFVDGDRATVTWGDGGKKAEVRIKPGKHKVEVKKDGFTAVSDEVTLEDRGRRVLRARLEKAVAGAGPARPTNPKPASAFFNGEDLSGWEGLPGYWDVKDGAIVGRPPPGRPAHTFLVSRKKYRDFDLKFEARRLDGVGNSGVQFRSRLIDAGQYKVVGPQVEIDSLDYNFPPGSLLTEPNLKPLHEKAPRDEVARVYKDADFNAFHVRCVGKHVTIRVNGVTTIDGDFPSLPDEGVIAWQIHGRMTPKEVTFRNIEFTDLSRAAEGFVPLFNGRDLSGWEPVGTGRWIIENGTLRTLGKDGPGWLATERDYDDFELELEYRLGPRGNSGVFVRAWTGGDPGGGQFVEIQLIDDKAYGTDGRVTGTAAIYGVVAPEPTVRPTLNTWHKLSVRAKGRRLQVSFDTRQVIDANLDEYPNFFQRFPGLKRASGRIGLQNTGTPVEFRNIKIKELSAGGAGNLEAGGGKVSKAPGEKVGEVRRFEGHKDAIHCVAVSPDGRLAASASGAWYLGNGRWVTGADDLTARLWDLATGRELHCLDGHSGTVTKVAFSPGGDRLVTCGTSDQTIRVWDTRTGKELRCIKETHAPQVRAVAFLPDGRRILSAGHDKMVRLWDGETGEQLRQFEGHAEVLHTVAVSPDGHRAASGGWEKAIRLWDLDTGQELRQFEGHTEAIHGLAFSPDGRRLLSASYDNSVRLWAVATGKELKRLDGHTDIVATVAFSPDGRRALSSGFDQTLRLWDLETGKELHCFRGTTNAVIGAAFTPDGRYALSGGADKVMRLWRLPDPPPAKVGEVGRFEESDVARPGT